MRFLLWGNKLSTPMHRALLLTSALIFAGTSIGYGAPAAETIIQQARAHLGSEDSLRVHSLVKEATLFDPEGNKVAHIQFKAQYPNKRWEYSLNSNGTIETINGTDGLEGYSKRVEVPTQRANVQVLSGRDRAFLFDLTEIDLGFYSAPRKGSVQLEEEAIQQGRACHPLLYTYAGGRKIRYYFDKATAELIAQEILSGIDGKSEMLLVPEGEIQTANIRFPKKFSIYENGKKTGDIEYINIIVNAPFAANEFAFPAL